MLVEHHIKYKEIHGVDETVWIEKGEHKKLHNRLRKEGKCNIEVELLKKISETAYQRTSKCISQKKEYIKEHRKPFEYIDLVATVGINTRLVERVIYHSNGNVYLVSRFMGNNGHILPVIII